MELLTVKMLNTAIERIMNQEMAELGLTYTQTTVIGYLIENQDRDICQRDIEYSLGLAHPTVSSILARMESGGLVTTQAMTADRRYKKIILTDKAISLTQQINRKYEDVKKRLFDGVTDEQRKSLNGIMRQILENTQKLPTGDVM